MANGNSFRKLSVHPVAARPGSHITIRAPVSITPPTLSMLKVISANLNGIRSATNKGFLDWMPAQDADFICMQELKAQAADMTAGMLNPEGYYGYFHYAEKKGYSGVGIYARHQPLQVIQGLGVPE